MTFLPTSHAFAIACGTGGAFVDVSDWVLFNEGGVSYRWGSSSPFDDVRPGQFSVTLDNSDGRFSPGSALQPSPLVEGMRVVWSLNGRLVEGTVRSFAPVFADVSNAETARMVLTCEDALGGLSRVQITSLWDSLVSGAGVLGLWKFDEPVGSNVAFDSGPNLLEPFTPSVFFGYTPTFGAAALPWIGATQAQGGGPGGTGFFSSPLNAPTFPYPANSGGFYSFWFTPISNTGDSQIDFQLGVNLKNGRAFTFRSGSNNGTSVVASITGGTGIALANLTLGKPMFVELGVSIVGANQVLTMYIDGALIGTSSRAALGTGAADLTPDSIRFSLMAGVGASLCRFSRLSHTLTRVREDLLVLPDTATTVLGLLQAINGDSTLAPSPSLSNAKVSAGFSNVTVLDAINEVVKTEQGYVYAETGGTLTNPTTQIVIRERTRPATVSQTFTTTEDILGAPSIARDLADTASAVTVTGPAQSVAVNDESLIELVGNASRNERVLLLNKYDLRAWGQDRIIRGTNRLMDVRSFRVDARGTETDRWSDLLSLRSGDRVRVAGLPATQLGFTAFDGWLIGGAESHTEERDVFTITLARALPATAIYDTDRYAADGNLSLPSAITNVQTSISIASIGALLTTTETPFSLTINDEQVTVTAVSGASSPQTATIVRGQGGTTAVAHGPALIEVTPVARYAF